ncbi:hypothetical protein ACS0TY_006158 [Phlomoides rotata]
MEFVVITGLKFGPTTEILDSSKFFNKVFRGKTSLQVKDVQLAFLKSCKIDKGSGDEALKLALLWVLFGILLMKDKTTKKIDMKFVHLVDNLDDFNNYPWGRLAYDVLVKNMRKHMGPKSVTRRARKLTTKDKPTLPHIDVHGFANVLQLWAYEAMSCVASYCVNRRSKTSIPRMLRWDASKAFRFDELTQNRIPILKVGDKMSERHGLAGSKRARDDVTKRRTKRKEEDRVDSKGSIEDEVKQLKKSYKIMEKAMEEIKAAQAIIMRKLKVHDMDEEEDEGEESDEKDENDESEVSVEEADEAEEEIGEDQGDEKEQEVDGEGQDEQEAADDGEDSDEGDEEDGEDRDEGDEGNEEDGEKDEEEDEKEDDEERDDGQSVGKNVGQEKGKRKCKNDDAIEEFEEHMLGMTDTPMFPGFMYDPLDDQIPTGAKDDLLLWLGENQETGLMVTLSVENIPPATAHWFDSIWDDQGWLVSENINAIMNLIILKAQKWPTTFNKRWTTIDLTFWAKMTNAVYVNWKKADKTNDWAWLDEENVVIDYILGKLPLHGTGRACLSVDKVFGVGHVTSNHWILCKMCISTQVITVYDSLGGDGGRGNPRHLSPVRKLASLMRGIC